MSGRDAFPRLSVRFYAPAAVGSELRHDLRQTWPAERAGACSHWLNHLRRLDLLRSRAGVVPASVGLSTAVATLAALVALMLVSKPGTGHPAPDLTSTGRADLDRRRYALAGDL